MSLDQARVNSTFRINLRKNSVEQNKSFFFAHFPGIPRGGSDTQSPRRSTSFSFFQSPHNKRTSTPSSAGSPNPAVAPFSPRDAEDFNSRGQHSSPAASPIAPLSRKSSFIINKTQSEKSRSEIQTVDEMKRESMRYDPGFSPAGFFRT